MKENPSNKQVPIDFCLGFYSQLFLILTGLLLMMIIPLLQQPIPLHVLTAIKIKTPVLAPIIITIHPDGKYELNTKQQSNDFLSLDAMKVMLKQQLKVMDPQQVSICLRSDANTSYGYIVEMIEWLNELNIQNIGLLHDKSK